MPQKINTQLKTIERLKAYLNNRTNFVTRESQKSIIVISVKHFIAGRKKQSFSLLQLAWSGRAIGIIIFTMNITSKHKHIRHGQATRIALENSTSPKSVLKKNSRVIDNDINNVNIE